MKGVVACAWNSLKEYEEKEKEEKEREKEEQAEEEKEKEGGRDGVKKMEKIAKDKKKVKEAKRK